MENDFKTKLKKAYIEALKDIKLYKDWKEGGAIYISLLRVYKKYIDLFGEDISYEDFIKKCKAIVHPLMLSRHPRYLNSKDKGYSIYISQTW